MTEQHGMGEDRRLRVLLAVADDDESVRVATTARRMFGDAADYVVVSVGDNRLPLGDSPMDWGVPYPVIMGGAMEGSPFYPASQGADPTELRRSPVDMARQQAEAVAQRANLPDATAIGDVGDVAERIRTVAEDEDVDLVVVGGSDRGWLRSLIERPVATSVLRHAHRPVLVVP